MSTGRRHDPWFRGRESTLNNSRHSERLQRGHAALNNSRSCNAVR